MPAVIHSKAHKSLVATIIAYRKEAGLSQAEFAKACKRNVKWASAVETGVRGIQGADLPAIARALGTTPLQFYKRFLAILAT